MSEKTVVRRGCVFEVREFCLHDGPGIRTTVFLKGCPLRCAWCHNPEGLSAEPEILMKFLRCRHCGQCEKVCPKAASPRRENGRPIDCDACGACTKVCAERCREVCGKMWSVEELAGTLRRQADVFASSGGGVTFSGGEPLMQGAFVAAVARALHPIPCAIETSGFAPRAVYEEVISEMDFVYQDLKHPDPAQHKRWTGVDPACIHENLAYLAQSGKPFVVRIPLIPGVNDSLAAKEGFARLIRERLTARSDFRGVELLPYHLTAGAKYPFTGRTYAPAFDPSAPLNLDLSPFLSHALPARIL